MVQPEVQESSLSYTHRRLHRHRVSVSVCVCVCVCLCVCVCACARVRAGGGRRVCARAFVPVFVMTPILLQNKDIAL